MLNITVPNFNWSMCAKFISIQLALHLIRFKCMNPTTFRHFDNDDNGYYYYWEEIIHKVHVFRLKTCFDMLTMYNK